MIDTACLASQSESPDVHVHEDNPMMIHKTVFSLAALVLVVSQSRANDATTAIAAFDESRPDNWGVNFGHWEAENGHLVCRELPKDKHAAASRWKIPLTDGTISLNLKLADAKQFHIGFDPAPGTLKKKGHLYSLIVSRQKAMIKRHRDKADQSSADSVLATAEFKPGLDNWVEIELVTVGNTVRARVGDVAQLSASDPTFHVAKPAVVFRVAGGEAQIDNVKVSVQKP